MFKKDDIKDVAGDVNEELEDELAQPVSIMWNSLSWRGKLYLAASQLLVIMLAWWIG